eukprot:CAMPEP_0197495676 /NCGR_PEP_ID=MMETSP1311-20131121/38091_1 /TAXON_ID=464262 /ORGANISM="Genus nov. species nov., Strain RCC856" /LENGTH=162 /DNA_ID=CAMNT_0043041195 /DNA_START=40 /DNA_END=525 /DNA_ORIENTATION=+
MSTRSKRQSSGSPTAAAKAEGGSPSAAKRAKKAVNASSRESPEAVLDGERVAFASSDDEIASASGKSSETEEQQLALLGADKSVLEEEEAIRKAREEKEAQEAARAQAEAENLDSKKYDQLNHLLDQTNLYSKFLSEQMQEIETQMGREAEELQQQQQQQQG